MGFGFRMTVSQDYRSFWVSHTQEAPPTWATILSSTPMQISAGRETEHSLFHNNLPKGHFIHLFVTPQTQPQLLVVSIFFSIIPIDFSEVKGARGQRRSSWGICSQSRGARWQCTYCLFYISRSYSLRSSNDAC